MSRSSGSGAARPILLTSGYSTEARHRIPDGGEIPLIAKPFDYDSLLRTVRDMLR